MPLHRRASLALLAAGSVLLAGCASGSVDSATQSVGESVPQSVGDCTLPTGALGIAAAGRANAPIVSESPTLVAAIDTAIAEQTYLFIYDTGGQPHEVAKGSLEIKGKNGPARADEAHKLKASIRDALQTVRSSTPQANPLQALTLVSSAVKAIGPTGTVVLADSGLQTTGALDYTKDGMLLAEPQELAEALRADHQLPDLTGITVALTGIGDTVAPQQQLDTAARARLQEQWKAIVTAAGAACVYLDPMPNGQVVPTGVPAVAPVTPPPAPQYDLSAPIALRGDVLAYQDNSSELLDPEAAQAALAPLVQALKGSTGSITLTGTTATGGTVEGRIQLSAQRAETAKQLLVTMGVDGTRIRTEGVGTDFPSFRKDTDASGRQIPEVAALNRSVLVSVD